VVEGARLRGRPKRIWKQVVEGDMKSFKIRKMHWSAVNREN